MKAALLRYFICVASNLMGLNNLELLFFGIFQMIEMLTACLPSGESTADI